MKSIILTFILLFNAFTAFTQNVEGTYSNEWISDIGEGMIYTITLEDDGSFTFYYTRKYIGGIPDKNVAVEGTWTLDGRLLILDTDVESPEESEFASELDSNKARFVSYSPRHHKYDEVEPSLEFYESDVFYLKDMDLIKTKEDIIALHEEDDNQDDYQTDVE
ncbi:hypothetical protein [Psychroserpens mesophilus]|uniref:hypothetical protein n=1 Tax=Psychroserpens mesophilus TaxID=325473 RepID=UPI003D6562E7